MPLIEAVQTELRRIHHARGLGEVDLPDALSFMMPGAAHSASWQYVFPATHTCADPATGRRVRYRIRVTPLLSPHRPLDDAPPDRSCRSTRLSTPNRTRTSPDRTVPFGDHADAIGNRTGPFENHTRAIGDRNVPFGNHTRAIRDRNVPFDNHIRAIRDRNVPFGNRIRAIRSRNVPFDNYIRAIRDGSVRSCSRKMGRSRAETC